MQVRLNVLGYVLIETHGDMHLLHEDVTVDCDLSKLFILAIEDSMR